MKNIFNISDQAEILNRLEKLNYQSVDQSGKMNAEQMLTHCIQPLQVVIGDIKEQSNLIGFIKKVIFSRNNVSIAAPDTFEMKKKDLKVVFEKLINGGKSIVLKDKLPSFPFSGKITADKWSQMHYDHIDHHLRLFGV